MNPRRRRRDITGDRVEVRNVRPRRVLYALENNDHSRYPMVNSSQSRDASMGECRHSSVDAENISPNVQCPFRVDLSTQNSVIRSSVTQPSQYLGHGPRGPSSIPTEIQKHLDFQSMSTPDVGCSSHVSIDPFIGNKFNFPTRSLPFSSGTYSMVPESHVPSGAPNVLPTTFNPSNVPSCSRTSSRELGFYFDREPSLDQNQPSEGKKNNLFNVYILFNLECWPCLK